MINRVMIAGGGTGGHLFSGLAVVEELLRRDPSIQPVFVGTERGIEARVLPAMNHRLELLNVQPIKGASAIQIGKSLGLLPTACVQALHLVCRQRPSLVLGVGGYASGPMLIAASMMGVPTALLEQNSVVGLTNRLLAPWVDRAYVSFEETTECFGSAKVRLFGNPIRRAFVSAARCAALDPDGFEARSRTIAVLGGSQGAKALNQYVPRALAEAGVAQKKIRVVHQTGSAMVDEVKRAYTELGIAAEVEPFVHDMAKLYSTAMLVIARAGATTVAEVCAIGRPAIYVPLPHAADNHQLRNAQSLVDDGAALCVEERALRDTTELQDAVRRLIHDRQARRAMATASRRRGAPEAAASIVDDLLTWLGAPASRAMLGYGSLASAAPSALASSATSMTGVF
jgi:UDP-N-acetylglucosamine--N-acetylmuramyl-(pentapeptide) pyrophosphoryl-undecaprenol N-acetylglucosamine transferase